MSQAHLVQFAEALVASNHYLQSVIHQLQSRLGYPEQERIKLMDELLILKSKFFAPSSERRCQDQEEAKRLTQGQAPKTLLPSLRYPNLRLVERDVEYEQPPHCKLCEAEMQDMGLTEDSEYVAVIPKDYHIVRIKRHKYRCSKCHGDIKTAPALPRLKPGSSFGDEVALDVAISKYADHLPVERYVKQCERSGLTGIKPQTLIDQTHYLAQALSPVYQELKKAIEQAKVLHSDETPWKMLEGDAKNNWCMWGFSNEKNVYYEAHDSRASEVAKDFLKNCNADWLMSDAYSGYARCTAGTKIKNAYCMAHARRKWIEAELNYPEATTMINLFGKLYLIERAIKNHSPPEKQKRRSCESQPILEEMRNYAVSLDLLPESAIGKARAYLLKHWQGLTVFVQDGRLPIDNNLSERSLRGPVLGRKNYYGNHSKQGAQTTAILYSIIESCKLNKVNPHHYLKDTLQKILCKLPFAIPENLAQHK